MFLRIPESWCRAVEIELSSRNGSIHPIPGCSISGTFFYLGWPCGSPKQLGDHPSTHPHKDRISVEGPLPYVKPSLRSQTPKAMLANRDWQCHSGVGSCRTRVLERARFRNGFLNQWRPGYWRCFLLASATSASCSIGTIEIKTRREGQGTRGKERARAGWTAG